MNVEQKLCMNCAHFQESSVPLGATCLQRMVQEPVYGRKAFPFCVEERGRGNLDPRACGVDGANFKAREA